MFIIIIISSSSSNNNNDSSSIICKAVTIKTVLFYCNMTNKYCGDLRRRRIRETNAQKHVKLLAREIHVHQLGGFPRGLSSCARITWRRRRRSDHAIPIHTGALCGGREVVQLPVPGIVHYEDMALAKKTSVLRKAMLLLSLSLLSLLSLLCITIIIIIIIRKSKSASRCVVK